MAEGHGPGSQVRIIVWHPTRTMRVKKIGSIRGVSAPGRPATPGSPSTLGTASSRICRKTKASPCGELPAAAEHRALSADTQRACAEHRALSAVEKSKIETHMRAVGGEAVKDAFCAGQQQLGEAVKAWRASRARQNEAETGGGEASAGAAQARSQHLPAVRGGICLPGEKLEAPCMVGSFGR